MTTYAETCGAPRGTMGFRDASGRARYKAIGAPDSESFATIKEAEAAARKRALAEVEAKGTKATGGAKAAAAPYRPPSYSKADVDKAALKARAEERARVRAVFASEHSKGRERLCATLLGAPDGWTAQQIIGALPSMGDDRTFAAKLAAPTKAKADAVWARANAAVESRGRAPAGQASAPAAAKASAADGVWERANAKVAAQREAAR